MPTPTRLTAKDLVPGGSYLHRNGHFVRHIEAIDGDTVHYHDQYSQGSCSKQAFLTKKTYCRTWKRD
jgi:hypothetical protein